MSNMPCKVFEMEFSIGGLLRYCTHLELLSLFSKLLIRVGLPVRFSCGFNPSPRVSLTVARPTGVASDSERLRCELENDNVDPEEILKRCSNIYSEPKIRFIRAWLTEQEKLEKPVAIVWQVDLNGREDLLSSGCKRLLTAGSIVRKTKGGGKQIILSEFIRKVEIVEKSILIEVAILSEGTLRPAELVSLIGLDKEDLYRRVKRASVIWESPF